MGKGGLNQSANKATIAHGNPNSRVHEVHQAEQKERRAKAKTRVLYEDVVPEDAPEMFKSNLLGLVPPGMKGRTFWRAGGVGELVEMDGDEWERMMNAESERLKVWHERREEADKKESCKAMKDEDPIAAKIAAAKVRAAAKLLPAHNENREKGGKVTYHKHRLKDSDLKRKTYELRPDHSRALEYLAAREPASLMDELLRSVRAEKVRLFEEIYGRKVLADGEHFDSGHYHNDIWSYSTQEKEVVGGKRVMERGTFLREYGVGPGAARWDRHLRVLADLGHDAAVTGAVPRLLAADAAQALKDNKEDARDLRFMRALDAFVEKKLRGIDLVVVERAKKEYGEWLLEGYKSGKLGVKESKTQRAAKLEEVEKEVGVLQGVIAVVRDFFVLLKDVPGLRGFLELFGLYDHYVRALEALGLGDSPGNRGSGGGGMKMDVPAAPEESEIKGPNMGAVGKRSKKHRKELRDMKQGKRNDDMEMNGS